jgi:CO/xanthine dehydrogenase FAD-binding subunit
VPVALGDAALPLLGHEPDDGWVDDVATRLADATDPADDPHATAAYRRRMVRHLARLALEDARRRAAPSVAA